jgi:hypothetical protein
MADDSRYMVQLESLTQSGRTFLCRLGVPSQFRQKQFKSQECDDHSTGNSIASVEFISAERTTESYKCIVEPRHSAGIEACSRRLSVSDTAGYTLVVSSHPDGVPAV